MKKNRFTGKTVFITGGANPNGMSYVAANSFLNEEASVFLYDRDEKGLGRSAEELSQCGRVVIQAGDVRSAEQVESAFTKCEKELGPVDILINHVGIGPSLHTLDITETDWHEVIDTNLTGCFFVARAAARRMTNRQSGIILNMCSTAAIAAEPGHAHYAASKAGVLALSKVMAQELSSVGIRVCTICPGDITTYPWTYPVELARLYHSKIAIGRSGRAEEVVAAYLYLASEDARNLNGCTFVVDGGMLAWE